MPNAKKKTDLSSLSYQDLEKEADSVLKKLQDPELGLDESKALYDYGKSLYKEMESRLDKLIAETKDDISEA